MNVIINLASNYYAQILLEPSEIHGERASRLGHLFIHRWNIKCQHQYTIRLHYETFISFLMSKYKLTKIVIYCNM